MNGQTSFINRHVLFCTSLAGEREQRRSHANCCNCGDLGRCGTRGGWCVPPRDQVQTVWIGRASQLIVHAELPGRGSRSHSPGRARDGAHSGNVEEHAKMLHCSQPGSPLPTRKARHYTVPLRGGYLPKGQVRMPGKGCPLHTPVPQGGERLPFWQALQLQELCERYRRSAWLGP